MKVRNQKGFSLVEIMVAVGIMGIVGLGLASLITEMGKQQNAANVRALLLSQKVRFEQLVKDSTSWSLSVNDALNSPQYRCLRVPPTPPAGCNHASVETNTLALFETTGGATPFYDSQPNNSGFTTKGVQCSTYPSNACPIRWDITVTFTCQNAVAQCLTPSIRVQGQPNIPPAIQATMGLNINPANYEFDVTRGLGTRFDPILITEQVATTSVVGAGACATGSGVFRKFDATFSELQDPAGNVTVVSPDAMTFVAGSYQCRITAPAFKVNSHFVTFETSGGTVIGSASAPAVSPQAYTVVSNAVLEVSFTINAPTTFKVRHVCEDVTPTGMPGNTNTSFQLGFGSAPYSGRTTFATVACYRNG